MFDEANQRINQLAQLISKESVQKFQGPLRVGVDLGTADIVVVAIDQDNQPVAGAMEWATVVRDGLVVDYVGALEIVRRLKSKVEKIVGQTIERAATAIPPGTMGKNAQACAHVLEGAGLECTALIDEPTAAAIALGITKGAVVDIGGGTTGISIIENGEVIHTVDEPTGGHHLSLVLAGGYAISYEEAELLKRNSAKHQEIFPVVVPVIEKMASIIQSAIQGYAVDNIYLVGGTVSLAGFEQRVEKYLQIPVWKPDYPLLATPYGIAMCSN